MQLYSKGFRVGIYYIPILNPVLRRGLNRGSYSGVL